MADKFVCSIFIALPFYVLYNVNMNNLTVLIDENIRRIDKIFSRISFCAVEIPEQAVLDEIASVVPEMKLDKIRFGDIGKFHFSELAEAQRFAVIEVISKINVTAKIYTYYCFNENEKESKIKYAIQTIEHLTRIHKNKELNIMLEYADEYKAVKQLAKVLVKDENIFIIPDGFLAVFMAKLDNISAHTGANDRMYTLIREKIRLQVFADSSEKIYLKSESRL